MIKQPQIIRSLKKKALPKIAILVIGFVWLDAFLSIAKWEANQVIQNDVISYYSYLPAAIIYNDLTFQFTDDVIGDREIRIWSQIAPNGNKVQKMPMGLSVFYLPSFFVAHVYASFFDNPSGYSWPYEFMISFGGLVFGIFGLLYLSKVLLRYFSPVVTSVTLFVIALGTNLYYYVVAEGCMSHVYSFFLFAAFIYYFLLWNETPTRKSSIVIGLIVGLICLVRPSNGIIALIPLLYGIIGLGSLRTRLSLYWNRRNDILVAATVFVIIVSPQLIYWKMITGNWLYYSYPNESFYFLNPHIYEGLLSYRKGWLIYTPVMALALAGIFLLRSKLRDFTIPLVTFLVVNCYIVFSWWCWWYGGSFGARALIETYALLAIPLAAFFRWAFDDGRRILRRILITTIVSGFIYLNLFQTKQYLTSLIHWDSMNGKTYWAIFGRQTFPENYSELIQAPDYKKSMKGEDEY